MLTKANPDSQSTADTPEKKKRGPKKPREFRVTADGRLEGPELATQAELALLLNVRRETVWAWERKKKLTGVTVGNLKRYPREQVENLLRKKLIQAIDPEAA